MEAVTQLRAEWREPNEVLSAFADEPWTLAFLPSGQGSRARWSYVARQPDAVLMIGAADAVDPFLAMSRLLGPVLAASPAGPPFQGGLAGLAIYELADRVEAVGLPRQAEWPDLAVGRYPAILAFDHRERVILAIGRGGDKEVANGRAREALGWLDATPVKPHPGALAPPLRASDPATYERAVAQVRERIAAGEIFQANIARTWSGRLSPGVRPFDLFARLARQSAAPFAAYLRLPGVAVVSNSPERFVRVTADRCVETRPIKGTRPRGYCARQDARQSAALAASLKDRAENLMIVDLMRNDLARVCDVGTVQVPALFTVESFVNVHHLVSTVTGRLAERCSAMDLLRAAFPPGSITGAPKVQAMKVIAGLETPRGPYCGSMLWAGPDGAMDSSVLIRTASLVEDARGWRVEARAGAGIVADSDPSAERLETEAKIAALLKALQEPE